MRLSSSPIGETYNYPQLSHRVVRHRGSSTASDELLADLAQHLPSDRWSHVDFCPEEKQMECPTVNRRHLIGVSEIGKDAPVHHVYREQTQRK